MNSDLNLATAIGTDIEAVLTPDPQVYGTGVVSVLTSTNPVALGKRFRLGTKGLEKTTSAHMTLGRVELRSFNDVDSLIDLLASISVSQALCSSVPKGGVRSAPIVTKSELLQRPGALARTTECFEFPPAQPGLLILDYDPVALCLGKDELIAALVDICAPVMSSGVVWWCSGSSHIYNGEEQVQGLRGQRLYVMIKDISDSERAGEVIFERLWLAGHGRIQVSTSGQMLLRSLFDKAMFQTARLDFIGGAVCEAPLIQQRGQPQSVCGVGWLDTRAELPDLSEQEKKTLESMVREAKADCQPATEKARALWKAARVDDATQALVASGVELAEASERVELTLTHALEGELCGNFLIPLSDGSHVSVAAVLANPQRWDEKLTLDPLEPDYDGGRVVGKLYLAGEHPCLYSFAHGGKRFALRRQPTQLQVARGCSAKLAQRVAEQMTQEPDVFVRGQLLVQIVHDGLMQLDRHSLSMLAGGRIGLYGVDKNHKRIPADLPANVADMVISSVRRLEFRPIQGVLTLPCATPDGKLVTRSGYDSKYEVYLRRSAEVIYSADAPPSVPTMVAALKTIWHPWSLYEFASPGDRAGMLAAILTALSRPVLTTAPGFVFDASTPSSGKSLAASAINGLITGRLGAGLFPFTMGSQHFDTELQKTLVSMSLSEGSVYQLDNVVDHFQSAVLAAHLTNGWIAGRLLGGNRLYEGAARIFVTLTSNNASLSQDLTSRLVRIRIGCESESPQARKFPFQPDKAALASRMDIALAAITLMRGFIDADMPEIATDDARYPEWTRLIRNAVLWVHEQGLDVQAGMGEMGDPAHSLIAPPGVDDPKVAALRMLLKGLARRFGNKTFQARDIATICRTIPDQLDNDSQLIRESLLDLYPARQELSAITAGKILRGMRDQIIDGQRLLYRGQDRDGVSQFEVQSVAKARCAIPTATGATSEHSPEG